MKRTFLTISIFLALLPATIPGVAMAVPVECECVRYLRQALQVPVFGDAWTIRGNVQIYDMSLGDVLLTNEGNGHAALITGFEGGQYIMVNGHQYLAPQFITIVESNYIKCTPGGRKIPFNSSVIRGVFKPISPPLIFQ